MIEQKIFFTRNGEYTNWEKIDSLKKEQVDSVLKFMSSIGTNSISFDWDIASKKSYIFSVISSNELFKDRIVHKIEEVFIDGNIGKCDFNGALFRVNLNYMDISSAYERLQKIKESIDDDENDDDEISRISAFTSMREQCIDIRLTSTKLNIYKDNKNEQIVNTEFRIYYKYGLILMTDYTDYTHRNKIKEVFLRKIYSLLNDTYSRNKIYKLSDLTLRVLLKQSNRYASQFTFSLDDCINVDVNVMDDLGDNPLKNVGLKEFYDKHVITSIRIAMNKDNDKYITIDGEKGKIISRSKTLEVVDVDEFIALLYEVVKYDYLNFDYRQNFYDLGKCVFTGHSATKLTMINTMYKNLEQSIMNILGENNDLVNIILTRNTFLYCLRNNVVVNNQETNKYDLSIDVVNKLSKLLKLSSQYIISTYNLLIEISINRKNDLMIAFDEFVNRNGDLNVSQV